MEPTFYGVPREKYSILRKGAANTARESGAAGQGSRGREGRMAAKKKAKKFSVSKAVKANARERVGQPKPSRAIPERPAQQERKARHKETLSDLLAGNKD